MGFSNIMMQAAKSMPKSTMAQSIPSATYSSCSTTNMWWFKNCCNFSFTKLMEICSKPLYSKISNPAISSTAQKLAFFMVLSIRVSLHLMISHLKILSKTALAACSQVWPLVTHSVPTLILGLQKAFNMASQSTPKSSATFFWENQVSRFSLVITTFLDEDDSSTSHDASSELETIPFLIMCKSNDVKSSISHFQLFIVINRSNSSFSLRHISIVIDIIRETTFGFHGRNKRLKQVVKDVISPLPPVAE